MAGQFDFKLDTSAFTESAEATKNLAETLKVLSQRRTKLLTICTMFGLAKVEMSSKKSIKFLNNRLQILKMVFGIYMRISLSQKKDTFKPILMQLRRWMVYQRAVYPLVIIN